MSENSYFCIQFPNFIYLFLIIYLITFPLALKYAKNKKLLNNTVYLLIMCLPFLMIFIFPFFKKGILNQKVSKGLYIVELVIVILPLSWIYFRRLCDFNDRYSFVEYIFGLFGM